MLPAWFPRSLPTWRRALRRRRRLLLVLVLAGMCALALPALAPASTRTAAVLVAAHDLPAGAELGAQDVRVVSVAAALAPSTSLRHPEQAVGRRIHARIPSGRTLVPEDVSESGALAIPPGHVALVVPTDSRLAALLEPGISVNVLHSTDDPGRTGEVRADVLSIPSDQALGTASFDDGGVREVPVILIVDAADAPAIAYATHEGWVLVAPVG